MLGACFFTRSWGVFPASGAVPVVAGTAIALVGIHRGAVSGRVAAMLRLRPVVMIGLLSYSYYLWHWPLLVFDDRLRMDAATLSWRLALCAVALALAWLSWRFVEQPVRRWRADIRLTLASAGAAIGACAIIVLLTGLVDGVPPESRALADRAREDLPANLRCHFSSGGAFDLISLEACSSSSGTSPKVVVWGDSHGSAWRPLAWGLATHDGLAAAGLTMNSCLPGGAVDPAEPRAAKRACANLNEFALEALVSPPVDTVIFGMRWPLGEPGAELEERLARLEAALPRLQRVRRVIVIGPLPYMRRPVPECIQLGWVERCGISREVFDAAAAPVWQALAALPTRFPNVILVDPAPWFCTSSECPALRHGVPQYRDKDHLTASAARAFTASWLADPARYDRTHEGRTPPEHP